MGIVLIALGACFLTFAIAKIAAGNIWLSDIPNHRSSHEHATSKAGGVAFIAAFVVSVFMAASFVPAFNPELAVMLGTGIVAAFAIGLSDDVFALLPPIKLGLQIALASAFVMVSGPVAVMVMPIIGEFSLPPVFGFAISVFWIVGFMNAFNFIDGINGLAGGSIALGLAFFAAIAMDSGGFTLGVMAIIGCAAMIGFLQLNYRGGKIFLGDNGSQSVSFFAAALALSGAQNAKVIDFFFLPIILLPIIFDVTWTLAHRAMRHQPLMQAHREHNYQLLLRLGLSHLQVANRYMISTIICGLGALFAVRHPEYGLVFVAGVCAIFAVIAHSIFKRADNAGLLKTRD